MTNRKDSQSDSTAWVVPPQSCADRVSLGVNLTASATDLTPEFVKRLTSVVRNVQGIGDLTIGGDGDTEGNCPVLQQCNVNRDRCGVLSFCGTNN